MDEMIETEGEWLQFEN